MVSVPRSIGNEWVVSEEEWWGSSGRLDRRNGAELSLEVWVGFGRAEKPFQTRDKLAMRDTGAGALTSFQARGLGQWIRDRSAWKLSNRIRARRFNDGFWAGGEERWNGVTSGIKTKMWTEETEVVRGSGLELHRQDAILAGQGWGKMPPWILDRGVLESLTATSIQNAWPTLCLGYNIRNLGVKLLSHQSQSK